MEKKEYIRELLDKYLEGLTTLQEESVLKEYFSEEKIPEEFSSEAQWFRNASGQNVRNDDVKSLEEVLSNWVDQQEANEKKIRLRSWILGVAAGLAILIGATFLFRHYQTGNGEDTYQDPQIAYLEAKKVLMYVSQTLNKGTEKLQTVSRIEEGSNEMSIFSTFGSGLKNLELVSKYDETIEKQ